MTKQTQKDIHNFFTSTLEIFYADLKLKSMSNDHLTLLARMYRDYMQGAEMFLLTSGQININESDELYTEVCRLYAKMLKEIEDRKEVK